MVTTVEGPGPARTILWPVIKYLGSKRRLVPMLGAIVRAAGANTALDLFSGTSRVGQEFKRAGAHVTSVDNARYAHTFARCYVATDATAVDIDELDAVIARLNALEGHDGYVTETFCRQARFFQPHNGQRIDAIRDVIGAEYAGSALEPLLLTSLLEAADRVDSTTGVQMAYLKQWAPRSFNRLELRRPELIAGPGRAVLGDAVELVARLGSFDLAYFDPPYNQHRYVANYHVWETIVAWDRPEHYGLARKRVDIRDSDSTRSAFNLRREMPVALRECVEAVDASLVVVSYNDEAWLSLDQLVDMCTSRGEVVVLGFGSRRYVGAQIGIHNPNGERVGEVSHLHNTEYLIVAGAGAARIVDEAGLREALMTTSLPSAAVVPSAHSTDSGHK